MIKVSIIIPVYNVNQYIKECLCSVISQTYEGEIECIVIDDCGTDNSITEVKRIINEYDGPIEFKILYHKHNRGLSAARNTGIKEATGDYLYFLDSDDSIIPECIELMVNTLKRYPQAELIQAGAISKCAGFNIEHSKIFLEYTENSQWIKSAFLKRTVFPVTSWNKLIKKSFIIKYNLFFKEGIIHEDEHWNYYACKYLSSLAICKKNIYNYNIRSGSIMHSNNNRSMESWLIILEDFINNIDNYCRDEQIKLIFDRLHPMYVFYPPNISFKSAFLLKMLSMNCTFIGKITIWFMLHIPNPLNKKKIIYTYIINNTLAPFF